MDDFMKAILYKHPDSIPVNLSILPATWAKYGEELARIRVKYPVVFGDSEEMAKVSFFTPDTYHKGKHVDAWGCVWENISEGYDSIVTGHPLPNREDVRSLKPPEEDLGFKHGFMFLRLTDLRGYEEFMVDIAEEPEELQLLIDIVRDYNVRQAKLLVANEKRPLYYFGDDNGIQKSLPIHPDKWRKYIKPAYKAIYDVIHDAGALVYMHTDGCIWQIISDFIDVGVNVLNPQIRANGLDKLVETCKGKVCINLDLDRQMFPFATPEQIRAHIFECTRAMYMPEGGLMLVAEVASDVPLENIDAICAALTECAHYKG